MHVAILGPIQVGTNTTEQTTVAAAKQRVILAHLALRPNQPVSTDFLIEALWPEVKPSSAKAAVLNYVARLRRAMGAASGRLQTAFGGYLLEVRDPCELDHLHAADLESQARHSLCGSDFEAGGRLADEGLALWRGEPLEDVPCEQLQADCRPALDALRLRLEETRLDALLCLGHFDRILPRLAALILSHPFLDTLQERRMVALYGAGRRTEALDYYRMVRAQLRESIGADPSSCLRELHQQVLRGAPVPEVVELWRADRAMAHSGGAHTLAQNSVPAPAPETVPTAEPALDERAPAVPSQLPRRPRLVVGRNSELVELTRLLAGPEAWDAESACHIGVLAGPAGVGKTTVALTWAHEMAAAFPDGRMYLDLNGFAADGRPLSTDTAISALLDFLGVPPKDVPATPQGRAALYRSQVAVRRVLLVIDNARDANQVRPLLPSGDAARTLVTSRRSLAGLVALDGAEALTLEPLAATDSHELLARRIGQDRATGQERAIKAIADSCGNLPLALAVAAARAVSLVNVPLGALAAQLESNALNVLSPGDHTSDVRNVLSWSYLQLPEEAARVLRFLTLHPGPEITVPAAAALADVPVAETAALVTELAAVNLLTETGLGRYSLHSLVRAFATEHIEKDTTDEQRRAAQHRLLEYHLLWAVAADHTYTSLPTEIASDHVPLPSGLSAPAFADEHGGMAWMVQEQNVLMALVAHAVSIGFDSYAWRLAVAQSCSLMLRGQWQEDVRQARIGLAAAKRLGEPEAQAHSYRQIGRVLAHTGEYDTAHFQLRRALRIYRALGDCAGICETERTLGTLYYQQRDYGRAVVHNRRWLAKARELGHLRNLANALNGLSWMLAHAGEYTEAVVHGREALTIAQDIGWLQKQRDTWDTLGLIHRGLGDTNTSAACYQRAADLNDRIRPPVDAPTPGHYPLMTLAELAISRNDVDTARELLTRISLDAREVHRFDADKAARKLAELDGGAAA